MAVSNKSKASLEIMENKKPKSIKWYVVSIAIAYFICWLSVFLVTAMCDCNWNEYASGIFLNISLDFALVSSLIVIYLNKKGRLNIVSIALILGIGIAAYGFIRSTVQESDFMQQATPGSSNF